MVRTFLTWALVAVASGSGCEEPRSKRPRRCVSKAGHVIPCDRPAPNEPGRSVAEQPDPGERQDELERITGADNCDEVEVLYDQIHTLGPPCKTVDDCGWTTFMALSCGKAVHTVGLQRGKELEELDQLLRCARMLPKCRPAWYDSVLACQQGRCVGVADAAARP